MVTNPTLLALALLPLAGCAEFDTRMTCLTGNDIQCEMAGGPRAPQYIHDMLDPRPPAAVYIPVQQNDAPYSVQDDIQLLRMQMGVSAGMQLMNQWDLEDRLAR